MDSFFNFPNRLPFGDALGVGGGVALLGICIVFIGLVFLIILTILYPKFFGWILPKSARRKEKRAIKKAQRREQKLEDIKTGVVAQTTPVQVESVKSSSSDPETDGALIAVITAAIAASLRTSSNGIRIRSFRRSGTPDWGKESKLEQFRF